MIDNKEIENFAWGKVVKVHSIGDIDIIEYFDRMRKGSTITKEIDYNTKCFHPYLKGKDTNNSYESLDQAIIGVLCTKYEGANSRADGYIFSMLGMDNKDPVP